jgi:ElaB/YqjD/DUF883 family membrane-anchored ribosome-binding protein
MIQAHVKKQFDAAIGNVESALRELSDRLESLSQSRRPRSPMRRAGRNLKQRASSLAGHVPLDRASAIAADTGRTFRQHPVTTVLTAAVAGYCVWSLIQYSTSRSAANRGSRIRGGREDAFGRDESGTDSPQRVVLPGEAQGFSRH